MKDKQISISVRSLVEFIMRSGDIDSTQAGMPEIDAMQKGGRLHRKLQKAGGPSYKAEVWLTHTVRIDDGLSLQISGRADGIITETAMAADENGELSLQEIVTIDEIKGTYQDPGHITEPVPVHLAQAMCYAYFYCLDNELDRIRIQVTYIHLEKETVKRLVEEKTFPQLRDWFDDLIGQYAVWLKWQQDWEEKRESSIGRLHFPYAFRSGQKRMVAGVYTAIREEKRLFAMAPTGTGKTLAALYPAIQAVGKGMGDKIFYLTARTITRTVAQDSISLLQRQGLALKCITITAKDKICIFEKASCDPQTCPRAKGHYDRVNDAVFDMIAQEDKLDRECIEAYAEKHQVCPFEMQLDASLWSDAVICDYNYAFDPDVALKRFFAEKAGEYIFLVDEAHNLIERARTMYSGSLALEDLTSVPVRFRKKHRTFSRRLERSILAMKNMQDEIPAACSLLDSAAPLADSLIKLRESMEELLREEMPVRDREILTDFFFLIRTFLSAFERSSSRYLIYGLQEEERFSVHILCVDPSRDLEERLALARSAIFFSATLLPVRYYKNMLSKSAAEDYDLYVASPFDPLRCLVLSASDVSSRYSRRGRAEYEKISAYISRVIRARHGNYMVFFPSYKLLEEVFDVFTEREMSLAGNGLHILVQRPEMSEQERQDFLNAFTEEQTVSTIGFCVMGGIFSEGIDLKADRLIGVIIVGTGLPQISAERELIRDYFEKKTGEGFSYAYLYPGMNKVLQAGGRVIRTEEDAGVIALLDERFAYQEYKSLFPREWSNCRRVRLDTVESVTEDFWTGLT